MIQKILAWYRGEKREPTQDEIIQCLNALGEGYHRCGMFGGWIEVTRKGIGWDVIWCSGKTTHDPLSGPSVAATFFDDRVDDVYRSSISMWPVTGERRKVKYIQFLAQKICKAANRVKVNELQVAVGREGSVD